MTKLLIALMSVALILPALLHGASGRAHACTCMVLDSEDAIRMMLGYADAVAVGAVSARPGGDPHTVTFDVERQYHGANSRQFTVRYTTTPETICPGYTVAEGTRHLLWLTHREPQQRSEWEVRQYGPADPGDPYGVFTPIGCAASQLASSSNGLDQIEILERVTTPWTPERGAAWVPWAFTAGVLVAIALAVLASLCIGKRTAGN